jgi:ABC-type branched-subunit amino acid transport system ATPase component
VRFFLGAALALPAIRRESRAHFERAERALATVGLDGVGLDRAGSLPFGQQKLVEVARAIDSQGNPAGAARDDLQNGAGAQIS